jgi:hypothetical protein
MSSIFSFEPSQSQNPCWSVGESKIYLRIRATLFNQKYSNSLQALKTY